MLLEFGLAIFATITTALVSIPLHNKLTDDNHKHLIEKLIATNWIRTTLWTAKLFFLLILN
ncbi:MAG: hypothetical protein ACSHX7_11410 [Luteolibacter sp.]